MFKEGVRNLAKALDIPLHEDDKVTLQAVVLLVEERLSEKGLANLKDKSTKVFLLLFIHVFYGLKPSLNF